jgi:hypothetical protein
MKSVMPDYGFGHSDGHHKAVDFSSEKIGAPPKMRGYSF